MHYGDKIRIDIRYIIAGAINDKIVGPVNTADYLLYQLNQQGAFRYVEVLGLTQPTDNVNLLLTAIAMKKNWLFKAKSVETGHWKHIPDVQQSAAHFLKAFREGKLGPFNFDNDILSKTVM